MTVADELDIALAAAHAAGALALEYRAQGVDAEWKGVGDLVTAADRAAEDLIREHIAATFPGDMIVGEEGLLVPEHDVSGRRRWYVDPIDGTTNYLKGRHWWAVSIGFCDTDDTLAAGVVHLPVLEETYAAARGNGATRNDEPIHASAVTDLSEALCTSGFPGAVSYAQVSSRNIEVWEAVMHRALSLRAMGAIAPDFCAVADGRADAAWTLGVERWDIAAGTIIAHEAGAVITDLEGAALSGPGRQALVAAPGIHAALLDLITAHR